VRALPVPEAGARSVLGEVGVPEVGEKTGLVRLRAAGLNPLDNLIAKRSFQVS